MRRNRLLLFLCSISLVCRHSLPSSAEITTFVSDVPTDTSASWDRELSDRPARPRLARGPLVHSEVSASADQATASRMPAAARSPGMRWGDFGPLSLVGSMITAAERATVTPSAQKLLGGLLWLMLGVLLFGRRLKREPDWSHPKNTDVDSSKNEKG